LILNNIAQDHVIRACKLGLFCLVAASFGINFYLAMDVTSSNRSLVAVLRKQVKQSIEQFGKRLRSEPSYKIDKKDG